MCLICKLDVQVYFNQRFSLNQPRLMLRLMSYVHVLVTSWMSDPCASGWISLVSFEQLMMICRARHTVQVSGVVGTGGGISGQPGKAPTLSFSYRTLSRWLYIMLRVGHLTSSMQTKQFGPPAF